jgi:hypothetical protein
VLRWISEGCPDGRWTDFTYKTTALALQSRRLVEVSKRGGAWNASTTPADDHYLVTGRYPLEHWTSRSGAIVELNPAGTNGARRTARNWSPPPPRPPKPAPPDGLTPTRKLPKGIADAGGTLERDVRDDDTNYQSLVAMINRHKMAPDGQDLIMVNGKTYHHRLFRLATVSDWKTTPPDEVVAAERVGRWHMSVATLRSDKRLDGIKNLCAIGCFGSCTPLRKNPMHAGTPSDCGHGDDLTRRPRAPIQALMPRPCYGWERRR